MFLKIQNVGVAPIEALITLGVSTNRHSSNMDTIGQFGSGTKHAISTLLRSGIQPMVCLGRLKCEFFTKTKTIDDGLDPQKYDAVMMKMTGVDERGKQHNKTVELGFCAEHGQYDWTHPSMGLREFVSNAIDRSNRELGDLSGVNIDLSHEVRAKSGHTTVYIPYKHQVEEFYRDINRWFLQLGDEYDSTLRMYPNQDENCRIYKKGVFVRTCRHKSLFNYNFGEELELDECRNANDYDVKTAMAEVLSNGNVETIRQYLRGVHTRTDIEELNISEYQLHIPSNRHEVWSKAFTEEFGNNAVVTATPIGIADRIKRKGYEPVIMPNRVYEILKSAKIPTDISVLNKAEQKGDISNPTPDMIEMVNKIWDMFQALGYTQNKNKPTIYGFNPPMDGGAQVWGLYEDNTVYLHVNLSGKELWKTALEEVVHHISQAHDETRDFQDFLLGFITELSY